MKNIVSIIVFLSLFSVGVVGQTRLGSVGSGTPITQSNQSAREGTQAPLAKTAIKREVKTWVLVDMESLSDTIPVDTLSAGFQLHNPVDKISPANVQLGNLGAPWQTAMVSEMPIYTQFLFSKNLSNNFSEPEMWRYYNTRTPYTNLTYTSAGPKRRSEDAVKVLFTQNVNKNWNLGFKYDLISSIGRYDAQKVENRNFRFFSSYKGEKYAIYANYLYNKSDQLENGGIVDDNHIWNPDLNNIDKKENIRVNLLTASNRIDQNRLHLNQELNIGNVSVSRNDSVSEKLPVGTALHTFDLSRYRRVHKVDNLNKYYGEAPDDFFYPNIYADSTATRDTVYYTSVQNVFQLKFNEEANSLLKFGLRAFIANEIETFKYPEAPLIYGNFNTPPQYRQGDTLLVTTHIGGQIFKNLGENFKWNAGAKIYFQGYRTGDTELTGEMISQFRIRKDTAGLFAHGGAYLVTSDFFTQRYYSNHFIWNNRFDPVQTYKIGGGVSVPTRRLTLSAESKLINKYVFWNTQALPQQSNEFIQLLEFKLKKHLSLWNLHSKNTVLYQLSSHQDVIPIPEWFVYSSNYFENTLFKVLFFQIGFDFRYTTSWYAPSYMPASGQFYMQKERKVGDYPLFDVFLNLQLKRARIFVKVDHVNEGFFPSSRDYFHTVHYPMNPRTLRFGVSWNFYD